MQQARRRARLRGQPGVLPIELHVPVPGRDGYTSTAARLCMPATQTATRAATRPQQGLQQRGGMLQLLKRGRHAAEAPPSAAAATVTAAGPARWDCVPRGALAVSRRRRHGTAVTAVTPNGGRQ